MNDLNEEFIKEDVIKGASALLISTYLLRDNDSSLFKATLKAVKIANKYNVPVLLALGTSVLVRDKRDFLQQFIKDHVQMLAMNIKEGEALNGISDPLLSLESLLDSVDFCLLTVGEKGLYIGGHCDEKYLRETGDMIHTKSIPEYNRYEYSRAMRKSDCEKPVKIYTHLNPYLGGPELITNTNGAGDAALSALLHDMASNVYHKKHIPLSPKHETNFLTYSSLHQVAKYCNRVSYEVLKQNSPRLSKGLPQKEDVLEESYWER
jgi:inosine kinase